MPSGQHRRAFFCHDLNLKTCTRCGVAKTHDAFYVLKHAKDGRHSHCAECVRAAKAAHRAAHKDEINARRRELYDSEKNRGQSTLRRYGLTVDAYDALEAKQSFRCLICEGACATGRRLAVDHDHATGKVRGLLCIHCNTALGKFRDSTELLRRAITYLEKHNAGQ